MEKVSYEEVRADSDPVLRQTFINQQDLEDMAPYIHKVMYETENRDGDTCMITMYDIIRRTYSCAQPEITVYPNAFEICKCEDEFRSFLIDHEGQHAKDLVLRPDLFPSIPMILEQMRTTQIGLLWQQTGIPSVVLHPFSCIKYLPFHRTRQRIETIIEGRAFHRQLQEIHNGKRVVSDSMYKWIFSKRETYQRIFLSLSRKGRAAKQ